MKRIALGMIFLGLIVFGVAADSGNEGCALSNPVSDGAFSVAGIALSIQSQSLIVGGKRHQDEMTGSVGTHNIWLDSPDNRPETVAARRRSNARLAGAAYNIGCAAVGVVNPKAGLALFAAGTVTRCGNRHSEER